MKQMAENSPLIIRNVCILAPSTPCKVMPGQSLLIEHGKIKKIFSAGSEKINAEKEIDGGGKILLPGFINAHMHYYSTFARGLTTAAPSKNFNEVLHNLWWRLDKALTLDDCHYSALVMMIEAIRNGTTTLIDHHASPFAVRGSLNTIAAAAETTGIRTSLCYEVSDRDGAEIARQGLDENADFLRQTDADRNDMLRGLFGLHASFTLGDKTLQCAAEMGNNSDCGFHIHAAEAESDQQLTIGTHKKRVIERLFDAGILGKKTIAAHCVHINENEIDILAQTGTIVVHNPQSNLNNAVGIADIVAMKNKGILTGLGTDAMTVRMLEELRVSVWAQHWRQQDPSSGFGEAAEALFVNNPKIAQRMWGFPIGVLEEGAAGDVILVDYQSPTPLTAENVRGHLIFGISQMPVDTTIIAGKVLMENGKIKIDIDELEIYAKSRELSAALWKRM